MRFARLAQVCCLFALPGIALAIPGSNHLLAPGHVPDVVKGLQSTGVVPAETQMNLAIGLPLRNTTALETMLQDLYDPASPNYRQFLTPEQFAAQFGPTEEDYQAVAAFAQAHHLSVSATHPNRMLLDVTGAASDVEQTLGIHLRKYHRPWGGSDFFAPDTEPSVPAGLAILDVSGLSNYKPPQPLIRENAAQAQPQSGSGSGGTYLGRDFRAAYVPGVSLTGTGQSLGLLEFDGFYASDIAAYESTAGLAVIPVETVLLDGYSGTPTTGSSSGNPEVSLDIEMALSMAPGLSSIISYEAGSTGSPNDILNRMTTDNLAKQLSCSWGWGGGPSATTDQIFQQMAAQGQSFFCAAGDSDAYLAGAVDSTSTAGAPADSPYITSVGGTTLTTSGPGGSWVSETVWNWNNNTGSSGGTSSHYAIPTWQQGISMTANGGSTTYRNFPDVALTGNNIYVAYGNGTSGSFGGTSCAAPLWAAFTALCNQQLAGYGLSPLGFINPAIYAIGKGASYNSLMHDITTGNDTSTTSPSEFYATTGYDLASGWGTPTGAALINFLAPAPDALGVVPGTGFTSYGLVGGPFTVSSQVLTVTNSGNTPLAWSLANTSAWLNVSSTGGTIATDASATLTVSLNAAAAALAAGTNTATIWFTNLGTGYVTSRQFVLTTMTQLLQNGGFESGSFSGWTQSGNTSETSVVTTSADVHSGKYGAFLGPATTPGYLSQTLPTVPGQSYVVSFWMNNPVAGTPNLFNASWNGATLCSYTNLAALSWTNLQFLVTATNSSTVLQFGFRNDPQYFSLDDVSVTPAAAPALRSAAKTSSKMQFTIGTTAGLIYQVQYLTNLTQSNWVKLGSPFTATNSTTTITDNAAVDAQRYYRVVIEP